MTTLTIDGPVNINVLQSTNGLPVPAVGDAGKIATVKTDETGYELTAPNLAPGIGAPIDGIVNAEVVADDATDNAAAIQAANDWLATGGGGVIQLPRGTIKHIAGVTYSPRVQIKGVGLATILKFVPASSGQVAHRCGPDSPTELQYGIGIKDLDIFLPVTGSIGIRLNATCGAEIHSVFIESSPLKQITAIEIVSGANETSSFFNSIRDVQAHHVRYGVKFKAGVSSASTRSQFDNFRIIGDALAGDTASIGYFVEGSYAGQDSVANGGYIENIMTGVNVANGIVARGLRFNDISFENGHPEAADVDLGPAAGNQTSDFRFRGCKFRRQVSMNGSGHLVIQ